MDDNRIVDLYWKRSEQAITETSMKYGKYCYAIAYNILYNNEDSEESVNDTYLAAWNSMPPKRPDILSAIGFHRENFEKIWLFYKQSNINAL